MARSKRKHSDEPAKRQHIGAEIARLRRRRGWSRVELGQRSAMSRWQIARIEREIGDVTLEAVQRLASAFNLDILYFAALQKYSTEIDQELTRHLEAAGIDRVHWPAILALTLEARTVLLDDIRWLRDAQLDENADLYEVERQIVERGVQDSLPEILRAFEQFGFDSSELSRALIKLEEVPCERIAISDRLPSISLPVPSGIDPIDIFKASFEIPPESSWVLRWWAQAIHSAAQDYARQFPARCIYSVRELDRYIQTGAWGPGLVVPPEGVRRHIGGVVEILRTHSNYRIGLIDDELPLNLLIKGNEAGCLFLRRIGEPKVGLRLSRPGVLIAFRSYFDALWDAIPDERKDKEAVIAWLESRIASFGGDSPADPIAEDRCLNSDWPTNGLHSEHPAPSD
jgi:transcriptional regulator with XRE-family HTH domain